MWIKLTGKEKKRILENGINNEQANKLLNELIDQYKLVEYCETEFSSPINYVLEFGDFILAYSNPYKKPNIVKFGIQNPDCFLNELSDHSYYFRDMYGKCYFISNPYLSTEEIEAILDEFHSQDSKYIGDYSKINFFILGKERSYHCPDKSNLFIMSRKAWD
ncbi:MAG: hypothetical protein R3Y45_02225 [Bacillota bacterium]